MSILIFGKTTCPICHKVINERDNFYSFPSFVINTIDPLYFFSDASFHKECLSKNRLGSKAMKYAELYLDSIKPLNRKCIITRAKIEDYHNHIFIEYLTSDEDSFLHSLNFSHLDKRHIERWAIREIVVSELIKLKSSNQWKELANNDYLGKLITQLATPNGASM